MSPEKKSPQVSSGPLSAPTYLEFIIFALVAVCGVTAIVVFLAKRANTSLVAQAETVATQDTPKSSAMLEGAENAGALTDSQGADPTQGQPAGTVPDVTVKSEAGQHESDSSSSKADTETPVVSSAVDSPPTDTPARKTYSLAATAADGSVTWRPEQESYQPGQTVTLEAVPNAGYRFSNWTGDLSGSTNPVTLVMDASKSVSASFALQACSLTVTALEGSVTKRPDQASYPHGAAVTLEAVPNTGYAFTNWTGDLSGNTNPVTLVMDAHKSVSAGFALSAYSLSVAAVDGSVTKSPDQTNYSHGETVTLQAVPKPGHRFTSWTGDLSGNTNPVTLVMEANKVVSAGFALKTYSLTVAGGDGLIRKQPNQASYGLGETVTLEAVPHSGYSFTNWSGDLSGSANPATVVIDADKSVRASFILTAQASDTVANSIGMNLVYVPAGSFLMGSAAPATQLAQEYDEGQARFVDEIPQHSVRISQGFWMGQTEVTQGQYQAVLNDQPWSGQTYVQVDANNPAVYVSWDEAMAFCRKLSQQEGRSYRLPTEAEWEYACRAGTATRFSFGDSDLVLHDYAWFNDNADKVGQDYAHGVGQKKPNPWGLQDMHGNVFEWCLDYYDEKFYANSPDVDPVGPPSGISHAVRGGSWDNAQSYLRSAYRSDYPVARGLLVGFRVVSGGKSISDTAAATPTKVEPVGERTQAPAVQVQTQADAPTVVKTQAVPPITVKPQADVPVTVKAQEDSTIAAELPKDTQDTVKTQEDVSITTTVKEDVQVAVKEPAQATASIRSDLPPLDTTGSATDILDQAAVYARMGQASEAQAALTTLLKDKDAAVLAGYELGLIHYEDGQTNQAIPGFQDALSTTFPGAGSGRDEQALGALLNQEEDAARIRYELGQICLSQGKQDQAAKLFRDSLSLISAQGATYIGVKKCKSCHFKQWNSWRKTKMAKTFEVLRPGVRKEEKTKLKFDPNKDYTKDPACLGCHTSGYGMPGGYMVPTDGDTKAKEQAADNAGVTCEGCHGPGSKSVAIQEDIKENKRTYKFAELRAVGFHEAGVRSCTACHNASDPGKAPGYHFAYEERRKEGQHENIELKYRVDE